MLGFRVLNLELEHGKRLYYNKNKISRLLKKLHIYLQDKPYMYETAMLEKILFSIEIKSNDLVEGYRDSFISAEDMYRKSTIESQRIYNLFKGYKYISLNFNVNKNSLKELYDILSEQQLDDYSIEHMGKYYRTTGVNISNNNMHSLIIKRVCPEADVVSKKMNSLLGFINEEDDLDSFIKSQIIYLYFIYLHPYYDVNGRTGRTLAMWHLLNKEEYPLIIFNRVISLNRNGYTKSVDKAFKGNITPYLEFIIDGVIKELEKENIILKVRNKYGNSFKKIEYEVLEYFLTIEVKTINELYNCYVSFNKYISKKDFCDNVLKPLISKGIIVIDNNIVKLSNTYLEEIDVKEKKYI